MLSAPIGPELANAADIMIKDYMAVNAKDTVLITDAGTPGLSSAVPNQTLQFSWRPLS